MTAVIAADPFASGKRTKKEYFSLQLDHLDGTEVVSFLKDNQVLSRHGKVFFHKKSGLLIIYENQAFYCKLAQLIKKLDRKPKQVEIITHIASMSEDLLKAMGIEWHYQAVPSQSLHEVSTGMNMSNPAISIGLTVASIAGNFLNLQLAALEAENRVEILASPRLLTTHLATASIRQGTEIPYEVSSGANGNNSIEFKHAVLGLEVTPKVLSDGFVELNLHISQNAVGQAVKRSDGGEALTIDTEEIKTQVRVKNGSTVVLGGIFQQNRSQNARGVPVVQHLPVIGSLFKQKYETSRKKELVIFITPRILAEITSKNSGRII